MQLTHIGKYPLTDWVTRKGIKSEVDLDKPYPQGLVSQTLPVGTKILIAMQDMFGGPKLLCDSEIVLDQETKIWCKGFGVGLSSDHWLIVDDGDADRVIIIVGEPRHTTKQTRKKYGEDYRWEKKLDNYQIVFLIN